MKLHDAQLVVARGYGFDSWAAMKRKIASLTQSASERLPTGNDELDAVMRDWLKNDRGGDGN